MKVYLVNGDTALVDKKDYELVNSYKWYSLDTNARTYAVAKDKYSGETILMHRLIMKPSDGFVVHHKNKNGLDNRRRNLVIMTQSDNLKQSHKRGSVTYFFGTGRWRARIVIDGNEYHLGYFDTRVEGLKAVDGFEYGGR
jgi:hypothetical protein